MEKKQCNSVCKGIIIGSAVTVAALLTYPKTRKKIVEGAEEMRHAAQGATSYIKENREELIEKIRDTSTQISDALKSVSHDVKQISESAQHIKTSSVEVIDAAREVVEDIKKIKEPKKEDPFEGI
ncbi:YtxH domain-containing protein [Alkalihalobacterium chitinilyticum]|uniref:YtxH domain-containing protein n=1 Tax=Alkalihalobacterium chitinilyticum TaxID=2980103 RepID=A0ABT5VJ08_9BACI|nr:YtxH domain-containing protein [Alkalihalobacterium chitinilyticum]MDE5415292.1 YtxH domain-containing protein [Alkalihalobacterium chitinilyticum]